MRYRVLGPLEILTQAGEALLPIGREQCLLLACLLLHAPRVTSVARLIEILW